MSAYDERMAKNPFSRYKGGCRCVECRAAIAAYMRERRAAARLAS